MSDLIWFPEAQMRRIEPHIPMSHRIPRVDDRQIISGGIAVTRNGSRRLLVQDCPRGHERDFMKERGTENSAPRQSSKFK